MKIAVLLTVHNRCEKTLSCLKAFTSQIEYDRNVFDCFLVDDGSDDGTGSKVHEQFPEVKIIKGNGELFWNRGMLLAWETARDTYNYDGCLWLNDDVVLLQDALEKFLKFREKLPDAIIVGAMCSTTNDNEITYSGYIYKRRTMIIPNEEAVACDCFNGNFVYVPRTVYEKIGLLNPYFRHSCGDFEYGYRAKKAGINSYVIPVVGKCDRNPGIPKWLNPAKSMTERLRLLYLPTGNNPFEEFKVTRYESLIDAIGIFFYLHLKAIFPKLHSTK